MRNWILIATFLAIAATASVFPAYAQQKLRSFAVEKDWAVFENEEQCWVFSSPASVVNTRNGKVAKDVRRGEIGLYVGVRKGAPKDITVSFTGGYPFRKDSPRVSLGSRNYTFLTGEQGIEAEWAWPMPIDEDKVIEGMKKGNKAIVNAVSKRGTNTKDTFSLLGFTAALDKAINRCR